jgi:hypothetical protein
MSVLTLEEEEEEGRHSWLSFLILELEEEEEEEGRRVAVEE